MLTPWRCARSYLRVIKNPLIIDIPSDVVIKEEISKVHLIVISIKLAFFFN